MGSEPWRFDMFLGRNGVESKFQTYHAVAVRPGDVAASAADVPEPQSLALALLALGAAVATRRRPA
jgi:MYXO-CTERM domain-containing protein